jgi:thiosulfate/3-mercaptopyruvate sulfurtransferase
LATAANVDSPLVSVAELAANLSDPDLVIVDVRWYLGKPRAGREAYLAGHLPGAIFADLDHDLADLGGYGAPGRHPLPVPAAFRARMGSMGIGDDSKVVAYDDVGGWVAARLWWMLDDLGFGGPSSRGSVRVLDGGIGAWTAAGLPLSTGEERRPPAELHLANAWSGVIDRDTLRSRLGSVVLLDARAAERYRGEVEPVDPVAGHIPTAISAPYAANLTPEGTFLPAADLRARFESIGRGAGGAREEAAEVVVSCGSGTSALHHSLAMRLAGLPDPILYVGSYSDWSRSGYPIATGPEPGKPPE